MAKPLTNSSITIPGVKIPGVKVVAETYLAHSEDQRAVTISSFASDRSRIESGSSAYTIERRDLRKQFRVDAQQRRYQTIPIFGLISEEEQERFVRSGKHWRKSVQPPKPPESAVTRALHIRHTCEQTGREKKIFECTAHHWIVTRRDERDPQHGENWTETVSEGWYLNSEEVRDRYPGFSEQLVHRAMIVATNNGERVIKENIGEQPRGLCAYSEIRTRSYFKHPSGEAHERTSAHVSRISGVTTELFDASIFEPPVGFRKMPVYPSRLTLARHDFNKTLARLRWKIFGHA
jgi:hypothetical protein